MLVVFLKSLCVGLLLATSSIHSTAYATPKSTSDTPKRAAPYSIDATMDALFQTEAFMTVVGIKPMSLLSGLEPQRTFGILENAKHSGILQNREITWRLIYNPFTQEPSLFFFHESALKARLQDTAVREFLSELFPECNFNSTTAVKDLVQTVYEMTNSDQSSIETYRENILLGVLFGYPLEDVKVYAEHLRDDVGPLKDGRKIINIYASNNEDGYYGGSFAKFPKTTTGKEIATLQARALNAVRAAKKVRIEGRSTIQIFNDPKVLNCSALF